MSGTEGSGGVVITLADIYAAQQETTVKLAEISGALALQSQQDRNDKATLADHESRIRNNEASITAAVADAKSSYVTKAGAVGMVLTVAAVVGAAAAVIALVIH